jgi:hypothetical protein
MKREFAFPVVAEHAESGVYGKGMVMKEPGKRLYLLLVFPAACCLNIRGSHARIIQNTAFRLVVPCSVFVMLFASSVAGSDCSCEMSADSSLPRFDIGIHVGLPQRLQVALDLAPCSRVFIQGAAAAGILDETSFAAGLQYPFANFMVVRLGLAYGWYDKSRYNRTHNYPYIYPEGQWVRTEGVSLDGQLLYFPNAQARLALSGDFNYVFGGEAHVLSGVVGLVVRLF